MDNTITIIKQIRLNAALGKKKHFNAADRKEKYSHRINLSIATISLFASSSLFYSIIQIKSVYGDSISFALVLLTMILSWVQIYFNWQKQAFEHRRIANKYLDLLKTCTRVLSYIKDGLIKESDLIKEVELLSKVIHEINEDSDTCPTNSNDYQLAREGIEEGEEEYTEKELSIS
ncbi:MAG: SLATT domain-containing protein [Eubacteriaceae bacterium]|jgi:hypothetical protein|nr:SLATT domain-containing protein [Eubacteriaceae bacterium]